MKIVKTVINHIVLTTDASNRTTIPPNDNRYALIIGNGTGAVMRIQFNDSEPAGVGLPLAANASLELPGEHYGDAIRNGIFLLGTGVGQNITCVEFLYAP